MFTRFYKIVKYVTILFTIDIAKKRKTTKGASYPLLARREPPTGREGGWGFGVSGEGVGGRGAPHATHPPHPPQAPTPALPPPLLLPPRAPLSPFPFEQYEKL